MTRWSQGRCLFPPAGYGALPFAVHDEGMLRVFYSDRDDANRSRIRACSVDPAALHVIDAVPEPLVLPGPAGAFDESGCSMSCVVRHDNRWFLYYTGWVLGRTVPFYLAIGLAISDDGGRTFVKHSLAPVLDRGSVDPFLVASPSILIEDGVWRMWYVSAVEWERHGDAMRHRYLVKYAESRDGITWKRDGRIAIPFAHAAEYAMGRPHVVREDDGYRMWFCVRGDRYRIACAESSDGMEWHRVDAAAPLPSGWDDEMQAYPMTIRADGRTLLFYNGNGYGATGFGCAVAESGA